MDIVDLDLAPTEGRRSADRRATAALGAAGLVFAILVLLVRQPAAPPSPQGDAPVAVVEGADATRVDGASRQADLAPSLATLALPPRVTLLSVPTSYALPPALHRAVNVRGTPGLASSGAPAMIVWAELGTFYSISSWELTVDELRAIAEGLR